MSPLDESDSQAIDHAPVELPITWELDLHTFQPSDLPELIPAYLAACVARNFREVRIIHGKGTGTLRTTVQTILQRLPQVQSFRLGDEHSGGWGATVVTLRLNNP
ncbi:MAG: Smr/MutS family protein [Cephaloticoccus sp.]|nr:Smr/MutS family protein [Cephaloticoccus sp.]MCF7758962.1 Smr/MutS family protein [Cephaloticoccus sp.]